MTGEAALLPGGGGPWGSSASSAALRPVYSGRRGRLFLLALSRMIVTILTLGIGRFWMVTRLRRHYWSSIMIDGAPLEYTGRASEKLIGFLVAVVILAVYLLVANLGLTFISLSWFQGNVLALQLPFIALFPLIFWARYRARRYILARTRWRGIRFGLAPGAWGYAARAMLWWAATLLSLGFLYPLMQMKLARYVTDRSYYGDLPFRQRGGWGPLLRSWLWFWAPLAALAALLIVVGASLIGGDPSRIPGLAAIAIGAGFAAAVWLGFAFIRHQVFSFRYINGGKLLAGRTFVEIELGVWRVIGIYLLGWLVIGLGVAITGFAASATGFGALVGLGRESGVMDSLASGEAPRLSGLIALAFGALVYLPAVAAYTALGHAFLNHPLIRATVAATRIHGLAAAARARQRPHDDQAEAGGFADALGADVGGAF
ncbi:DUF898 family protein [Pikeienuella sp. HZG-20]|uniref:DUF898 family protein n=1 Tax=Paludibacillus litoralis TaxID=3133267 RepID=UPI0030EEAA55